MTRIRVLSDIHDDYGRQRLGVYQPPPDVEADVLVVAGDISGKFSTQGRDWLEMTRQNLGLPIVVVPGNHDFWRGSLHREIDRFRDRLQCDGIHVLDGDSVEVAGVRFVGGTLWTDYAIGGDQTIGMMTARRGLNDFDYMRSGVTHPRPRATPYNLLEIHQRHREAIRSICETPFAGPTVVVTHHAPSPRSLRTGAYREPLDAAYASDLESLMLECRPELWIHGHVHEARDYQVGATRVICNPRGYVGFQHRWGVGAIDREESGFDERLVVDVQRRPRPIPIGYEVEEGFLTQNGIPIGPLDQALDEIEREDAERMRQMEKELRAHGRVVRKVGDLTDAEMRLILAARVPDDIDEEERERQFTEDMRELYNLGGEPGEEPER